MEWVASAHLSPTGDRVVLNARGQLFVAPAQQGRVVEADPARGLYRVDLGDGFLTGWIRARSPSTGALKMQAEPTVGQMVMVRSESGDLTDAAVRDLRGLTPRWQDPRTRSVIEQSQFVAQQVGSGNFIAGSLETLQELPIDPEAAVAHAEANRRAGATSSLMARMAPPELRTEMFGLYALSGKATTFLGPPLASASRPSCGTGGRVGFSTYFVSKPPPWTWPCRPPLPNLA